MGTEAVGTNQNQAPAGANTCPICGISGFASVHGVVTHVRRLHGSSARPSPRKELQEPAKAPAKATAASESTPATVEINCPACGSEITSDGHSLVKEEPRLAALRRAGVKLSDLELEQERLRDENKTLKEQLEAIMKGPAERLKALEKENENLRQQIEAAGGKLKEPEWRFCVLTPSPEKEAEDLQEENERLRQQLHELEGKGAQETAEKKKD